MNAPPVLRLRLYFVMQGYIFFLFLSVTGGAGGTSFSDWLPDASNNNDNNLDEYNPSDYITPPQSNLFFDDPILFTNTNENNQALAFEEDQMMIPLDLTSLNPPWNLFADTSDDCSDNFLNKNKNRLKKREGAICASTAKKKPGKSRLGFPTLQDIEAQEEAAAAAAESDQNPQCPPKNHPQAVEAVCSSENPNDYGNSAVYEGALILANCERRMFV